MMRHLTERDYRSMPWANGRGVTVEMLREEEGGDLFWRLSRASVVEDGPFSRFAGVERNLTVISGAGFDLVGSGIILSARPLQPVAFSGDVAILASNVTAPCDDFNVMTARHLPLPMVAVQRQPVHLAAGGMLCLFALGAARVDGVDLARHDLVLTDGSADLIPDAPVLSVRLFR